MSKKAKSKIKLVLVCLLSLFILFTTLGAAQPTAEGIGLHPIVQIILSLLGGAGTFFFILKSYYATSKNNEGRSYTNERMNARQEVLITVIKEQLEKLEQKVDSIGSKLDDKLAVMQKEHALLREEFTRCKTAGNTIHRITTNE